ncbi:MAG: DUF2484 family protein [Paracoccaceae bacterium]|nr:DUF2484 family protein [Paracoccaceae bacterium]
MNLSLILAFCWLVFANVAGMFPSKHYHWPTAYVLIAIGLPLLGWVYVENGFWLAALIFLGAASVLRWPLIYLWRWVRRKVGALAR